MVLFLLGHLVEKIDLSPVSLFRQTPWKTSRFPSMPRSNFAYVALVAFADVPNPCSVFFPSLSRKRIEKLILSPSWPCFSRRWGAAISADPPFRFFPFPLNTAPFCWLQGERRRFLEKILFPFQISLDCRSRQLFSPTLHILDFFEKVLDPPFFPLSVCDPAALNLVGLGNSSPGVYDRQTVAPFLRIKGGMEHPLLVGDKERFSIL